MICVLVFIVCFGQFEDDTVGRHASAQEIQLDRPIPKRLVGREFKQKLGARLNLIRSDAELLKTVTDLQRTQNIAVVLDRRVDPNQKVSLNISGVSLQDAIQHIAERTSNTISKTNDIRIVGDTVVVGPEESLGQFRTLVQLRVEELRKLPNRNTRTLQELTDKETVHWNDLDRPIDILKQLATTNSVEIANPDALRHDLWRGDTMFNVNFIEAVSWILLQYDLTFQWNDDATKITLVALPKVVGIAESHRLSRSKGTTVSAAVRKRWPELKVAIETNQLKVTATVEQHDAIEQFVKTGKWPEADEKKAIPDRNQPNTIPLAKRNISLRVIRKPASAVLATLSKSGINIQYDPVALKNAGVDLAANIDLDVKNADINELMSAICKPVGMNFRIEGEVIHLSAK